jgi:class 3 adenylate cyclase/HAMP domain-containing protein
MVSMILLTIIAVGFARNGINKVTKEFLGYKINQIIQKANNELKNLEELDLQNDPTYVDSVKMGIKDYCISIIKKDIESVVAIDSKGIVQMSTDDFIKTGEEADFFYEIKSNTKGWISFNVNKIAKVGYYIYFQPWDWYILLSVYSNTFYKDANQIFYNSIIILILSIIIAIVLMILFINFIFNPLKSIIESMYDIIKLNDMSKRVPVLYNDEIGELAFTFNNMLEELDKAYTQIKEYAFQSVLAQKKEERIKNMFQKYVPQDVVDDIVHNPTRALEGKNKLVTVLFSDIRSFTTISESMAPDTLVKSLNRYFTIMVDLIYRRRGVIDKYIGDAIMAIFGAPKEYPDDTQQAVLAGLEMLENLDKFNIEQRKLNLKEFKIGIGINYGPVTVGNIGTSQKMDYTVIGDAVNLASRLEGLTKEYHTPIIVSEDTRKVVKDYFYFREIDRVTVKGKTEPVKIWQPARKLKSIEKKAWNIYNRAVKLFLERAWDESQKLFIEANELLGNNDFLCQKYIEDIKIYKINPPAADWDGTKIMTHK